MSSEKIKAVFFDCDGVVIDSGTDIVLSVNATLEHFGYKPISEKVLISYVGDGVKNLLIRSFSNAMGLASTDDFSMDEKQFAEICSWYSDYYNRHAVVKTVLYPGFLDLLKTLKQKNIPAGIVTNKPSDILLTILKQLEIQQYFAATIGGDQVKKLKPAPEGLQLALEIINKGAASQKILASECLMVGDSATDIIAGRSFGAKTCGVRIGLGNREKLEAEKPDFLVDYASELLKVNELF